MQIIRRDYSGPSFRILKLKIAIIGGGASGIVTAYLLDSFHQVTLFEKQSILGGNIRTLNKNVKSNNFSFKFPLDNGVIEFARDHSPYLNALMADLKIELEIITGGATSFFSQDGSYWQSPGAISKSSCPGVVGGARVVSGAEKKAFDRGGPVWPPRSNAADDRLGVGGLSLRNRTEKFSKSTSGGLFKNHRDFIISFISQAVA